MRGMPSILSIYCSEFDKFNNTGARMLDYIYHMMLRLFCNHVFGLETSVVSQIYTALLLASFHNVI